MIPHDLREPIQNLIDEGAAVYLQPPILEGTAGRYEILAGRVGRTALAVSLPGSNLWDKVLHAKRGGEAQGGFTIAGERYNWIIVPSSGRQVERMVFGKDRKVLGRLEAMIDEHEDDGQ